MKKIMLGLGIVLALVLAISVFFYLRLFSIWPEVSEEVKRADCIEAIRTVKFREDVFAQAEKINALNDFLSKNITPILAHNQLKKEPKNNHKGTNKLVLHLDDLEFNLPKQIAFSADSILQQFDKTLIVRINLYTDASIIYSIYDPVISHKPRNYRVFHNLNYNKRIPQVLEMGPRLHSLIKDTLSPKLQNTQYTIKIEPYMGW